MTLGGKRVLYISYNGMLDPLGQSQVIPYLKQLSDRGVRFWLMSFERPQAFETEGSTKVEELRAELLPYGIEWHVLRYHQKPSLPATMFDVAMGIRLGRRLVKQNNIELVHARSHVAARMALALKRRFGLKFIFDVRGLMADEYVDAAHWRKNSVPYRITKTAERHALSAADGVVTLTEKIWPIISSWDSLRERKVIHEVVPCCADLDRFHFDQPARERRRAELAINDRFVVVYSGSIDGWYLTEQMADFFVALRKQNPRAYVLWLTPSRHERIRAIMHDRDIAEGDYTVIAAASRDVPSYLSAADAGLAFIKPCFSKLASSPTKYAEYLGCGLPLIINAGVGDSDSLITAEGAGVMVTDFNEAHYTKAANAMEAFAESPAQTRTKMREIAERLFDVERVGAESYARLYRKVLAVD